jgi:hypothetical protein
MKHSAEYDRFSSLVDAVLAVPHSVIQKRVEEHRKQAAKNPNRPGPKPKVKASASARASRAKG